MKYLNSQLVVKIGFSIILIAVFLPSVILVASYWQEKYKIYTAGVVVVGKVVSVETVEKGDCFTELGCISEVVKIIEYQTPQLERQTLITSSYGNWSFLFPYEKNSDARVLYTSSIQQLYNPFLYWFYPAISILIPISILLFALWYRKNGKQFHE